MATFLRTSNAGGLLELDRTRILLDGISQRDRNYPATPADFLSWLAYQPISAAAFTHTHPDHFSLPLPRNLDHIILLGPEDVSEALTDDIVLDDEITISQVKILPVRTVHTLYEASPDVPHMSYVLQGRQCVWFLGDALQDQWADLIPKLPHPDVVIAPFPFVDDPGGWPCIRLMSPGLLILVHMPDRRADSEGVWAGAMELLNSHPEQPAVLLDLGETISFQKQPDGSIRWSVSHSLPHL